MLYLNYSGLATVKQINTQYHGKMSLQLSPVYLRGHHKVLHYNRRLDFVL